MGTKEVLSTPRSPWERAFVERLIGGTFPRIHRIAPFGSRYRLANPNLRAAALNFEILLGLLSPDPDGTVVIGQAHVQNRRAGARANAEQLSHPS